jgi:hypothetical protein
MRPHRHTHVHGRLQTAVLFSRLLYMIVAVISFIADVADVRAGAGQECASPFGTHSGTDL